MVNLGKSHWEVVKWVLRYIRGTARHGLLYKQSTNSQEQLVGYYDAYRAQNLDKRRSLTLYLFTLFGNTISWKTTLQSVVALLTTSSKYVAIIEVVKESLWLKGLAVEFGVKQKCVEIYSDSQNALYLTRNKMFHKKTKHIDIILHFIRDIISSGEVAVKKVFTDENPDDILTNSVTGIKFEKCLNLIGVTDKKHE